MNLLWRKTNIKRFGLNNLHQEFDIMRIVHAAIQIHIYPHTVLLEEQVPNIFLYDI